MTEKPKLDYFICDGKVIKRGDAGFQELEDKYAKEVKVGEATVSAKTTITTGKLEKGGSNNESQAS